MKVKFGFILFGVCALVHFGLSQSVDRPTPVFGFMAIIVEDIDTSIGWYQEKLGFSLENRHEIEGRGIKQANLSLGKYKMELIERGSDPKSIASDEARIGVPGFFKVGFTIAEFDMWISYLHSVNASFHGTIVKDPESGKRMAILLDPDGNRIQLFEQ